MNVIEAERPAQHGSHAKKWLGDPFFFLPIVVDALQHSDVSCRFCSVRLISRTGLVAGLCPACFEERCAKCGDEIVSRDGKLAAGLTVGRGGSWHCAKCCGPRQKRRESKRR